MICLSDSFSETFSKAVGLWPSLPSFWPFFQGGQLTQGTQSCSALGEAQKGQGKLRKDYGMEYYSVLKEMNYQAMKRHEGTLNADY